MATSEEKERLRARVEETKKAFRLATWKEQQIFQDRTGVVSPDLDHFEEWHAQHQSVTSAFRQYRAAVDEYVKATESKS